jgi:putative ABC transport system permease protein
MNALDVFRSLGGAFAHRLRAALTVLGIVIGTGAIVLLASLLHGGEAFLVQANQEASDDDVIEAHTDEPPPAQRVRTTRPLSRADAEAVERSPALPGAMVEPESSIDTYAHWQGRKKRVAVVSARASTLDLYRLRVARGRALDADDRQRGSRVCVIGHEVHEELLRGAAPLDGLRLEIDGRLLSVVGVLEKKPMLGATDSTYLWDRKVLIPETTYDALYAPSHEVQRIYVRVPAEPGRGGEGRAAQRRMARTTLHGLLLRRHLGVLNFALTKDESGGMERLILTVIHVLMLGTGLLALLASGINIMNVMLVTVSERRREIGLRRALGAPPRNILLQFLLEAVGLSGVGATVGVASGVVAAWLTALLARSVVGDWELAVPPWSIGLGLGLALATGLGFGIVPAWRAARVSPIEALRSE